MVSSNGINQQTYVKIFSKQGNLHVIITKPSHHSSHKNTNTKCEGNNNECTLVQIP
jgi:hypothetical protein